MERFDSSVKNRVARVKTGEPLPIAILTDSDPGETYPGPYVDIFIGGEPFTVTPLVELNEFLEMLRWYELEYKVRHSYLEDRPDA